MNQADVNYDANDETSFASRSSADRRRTAKKQARDQFGRWVSVGANVKWTEDNNNFSGLIKGTNGSNAIVTLTSGDKKGSRVTVPANKLKVITSKATLAPESNPYFDKNNDTKKSITNEDFKKDVDQNGVSGIQREDGYILRVRKNDDEDTKASNPFIYQLYAPSGRSLGEYTQDALNDFEDMIEADKAEHAEDQPVSTEPTEGQVDIAITASTQPVIRVSRDGSSVIINDYNSYFAIDLATQETIGESDTLGPLLASGSWRRPVDQETSFNYFIPNDIDVQKTDTPYRVPKAVKEAVTAALASDIEFDPVAVKHMSSLAQNDAVSIDTVSWIQNFFSFYSLEEQSRGGYAGAKWASKIMGDHYIGKDNSESLDLEIEPVLDYNEAFDDDVFLYIGVGNIPGSNTINRLYCVDDESGVMYQWINGMFALIDELSAEEFDADSIIILDENSAATIAQWIDNAAGTPEIDVLDTDPEERNLFTLAAPEIDFEDLERTFGIIADATGYTPAERSVNAKRQKRGPGGRFGGAQIKQGKKLSKSIKKGTIPTKLLPVSDVPGFINEWLAQAGETAEGVAPGSSAGPVIASSNPTGNVLYFAVVDDTDKTAVLDAIALSKTNNEPKAWVRKEGTWEPSPETVKDLNGATPPVVVHLEDEETVKNVLSQVDAYDAELEIETEEIPIAAGGFALPDGTFDIQNADDLAAAITASADISETDFEFEVKNHIRKRAHALNRFDLVPESWRVPTLAEIGYAETNTPVLFGDFGEVLTAGGIPGIADTPGDFKAAARLKNYWTRGRGAAKIRWGTPGDLTRAHRHLSKYVGPHRAWGLAQNYHKSLFGVSNITHDKATGQYRSPKKRRR